MEAQLAPKLPYPRANFPLPEYCFCWNNKVYKLAIIVSISKKLNFKKKTNSNFFKKS
jgi:hypothetical protein